MDEPVEPASATWAQMASRWWYVVRYHRPGQLARRLAGRAAGLLGFRPRVPRLSGPVGLRAEADFRPLLDAKLAGRPAEKSTVVAHDVCQGRFCFLSQQRSLSDPVDWRLTDAPRLWRFALHYHEFLLDLIAEGVRTGESVWFDRAWVLVRQWIEANRPDDPNSLVDAWHPYCISRRLPVWCLLWTASPPDDQSREPILQSMATQAVFLRGHLERDLGGNHLLENAASLVVAGSMLSGPEADNCLQTGEGLLRAELAEQILPHGEHFERAPMYHARMLEVVLDVRDAARGILPELSDWCDQRAAAMAGFLREILHPDGQIPLLGDSCFDETPLPAHLFARAGQEGDAPGGAKVLGDYWLYRDGRDFLLLDAGPVGPDHLPAHAHADLLTIEASVGGHRLIVDSGLMDYELSPMRRYCRSTSAHNTLQIDGRDQCDVWSRFRMGYRGHPERLEAGQGDGFQWARAAHDAYRRVGAGRVARWIAGRPGGPWFCLDRAEGSGSHELTGWLHLHPEVAVEPIGQRRFRVEVGGQALELVLLGAGEVLLDRGWYCPRFGVRTENPRIRWTCQAALPAVGGWCLLRPGHEGEVSLIGTGGADTLLQWRARGQTIEFRPFE